ILEQYACALHADANLENLYIHANPLSASGAYVPSWRSCPIDPSAASTRLLTRGLLSSRGFMPGAISLGTSINSNPRRSARAINVVTFRSDRPLSTLDSVWRETPAADPSAS